MDRLPPWSAWLALSLIFVLPLLTSPAFCDATPRSDEASKPRLGEKRNAVVFVHGFTGGQKTWGKFKDLLEEDPDLQDYTVYEVEFPTRFAGRNPKIDEIAEYLKTQLYERFTNYKNVYLVAHSMGGLVIQSMIVQELKAGHAPQLEHIRHIIFFGTPNLGTAVPAFLRWFNKQARDLDADEQFIGTLVRDWVNYAYSPEHEDNYNRKFKNKVTAVFGLEDSIVPSPSSRGVFEHTLAARGSHTSMKEPQSRGDDAYIIVKRRIFPPSDSGVAHYFARPAVPTDCQTQPTLPSSVQPRTFVTLFQFDGTSGPEDRSFSTFRGILKSKLNALGASLRGDPRLAYVSDFDVTFACVRAPSRSEIQQHFARHPTLEYLSGTIFAEAGSVMATVYFDETLIPFKDIQMEVKLKRNEYGYIKDYYAVATLYALALDAKRAGLPQDVIQSIFSKAVSIGKDLLKRLDSKHQEAGEVRKLMSAITRESEASGRAEIK